MVVGVVVVRSSLSLLDGRAFCLMTVVRPWMSISTQSPSWPLHSLFFHSQRRKGATELKGPQKSNHLWSAYLTWFSSFTNYRTTALLAKMCHSMPFLFPPSSSDLPTGEYPVVNSPTSLSHLVIDSLRERSIVDNSTAYMYVCMCICMCICMCMCIICNYI